MELFAMKFVFRFMVVGIASHTNISAWRVISVLKITYVVFFSKYTNIVSIEAKH